MDVKNGKRKDQSGDKPDVYVLTEDDVENILDATDALYWTILQLVRGRGTPIQIKTPTKKDTHV
jgi:hypothetical protein